MWAKANTAMFITVFKLFPSLLRGVEETTGCHHVIDIDKLASETAGGTLARGDEHKETHKV